MTGEDTGLRIRGLTITPDFPLTVRPDLTHGTHVIPVVVEAESRRVLITVKGGSGVFSWPTVGQVLERGQRLQIPVTVNPTAGSQTQATLRIEAWDPNTVGIPRRRFSTRVTARRATSRKPPARA